MTYKYKDLPFVDLNGVEINVGDILEDTLDPSSPWKYFTCENEGDGEISIRDFNAHNVAMCDQTQGVVQLTNIGHYSKHQKLLEEWNITPRNYWPEDFDLTEEL